MALAGALRYCLGLNLCFRPKAVIRYLSYYADGGASPRAKTTEYDTDARVSIFI